MTLHKELTCVINSLGLKSIVWTPLDVIAIFATIISRLHGYLMKISEKSAALFGFVFGALLLALISLPHRLTSNVSSLEIQTFIIPVFVGGTLGATIGFLLTRFYEKADEIEQLVQMRINEAARFEKEKEVALLEQERMTQEMLNQDKLVDTLLATLPAPVFIKDPDGRYQGCNRAYEDLIGITVEELRGKTAHDLYDEKSASLFEETDRALAVEGGQNFSETTIVTRCGHVRDVQITKKTYHLSDGSLGGFVGVLLDVTESRKNERALAKTVERLDLALKGADMGFWDWNVLTGEVIYSNRFIDMLGFDRSEVSSDLEWWQRLIHPADIPKVWSQIEEHIKGIFSGITAEYRIRHKSGAWLWMRARGKVVERDEKNRPTRAAGTQIDITSSRKVMEALEDQIKLMESLLAAIPNPIFFKDTGGRYLGVNKAYEQFTGFGPQDVVGKKADDFWHKSVAEKSMLTDEFVLTRKQPVSYEFTRKNAQGEERNCSISKAPVFKSNGAIDGLIGIITDITDSKRFKDALAESEEKYRTVVEYAGQMIAITQRSNPVFVNRKALELTGYSEEELINSGLAVFIHPDDLQKEKDLLQDTFRESNLVPTSQYRIVSKDGDTKWCEEQTVFINWKSKPATLHFITEITERKKAEDILLGGERLKAIADLAIGVAHNFNNVLQIIIGGAGLALMDLDSGDRERVRSQLKQIVESARFGAAAVRKMEDFANVSSKKRVGAIDAFDVSDLVRRAVDMTEPWWKTGPEKQGHKIAVKTHLEAGLVTKIQEEDLFEILINIIKNATEACAKGGTITLSTRLEDDKVFISTKDDGIGIPKENLGKIFEPFWTSKGLKATGMGLSSCLGVVKRYNGDITIKSEPGLGTEVLISLPGYVMEAMEPPTPAQESPAARSLNILVVDDMEMIVELLSDGLSEFGHNVHTALSGAEAISQFRSQNIDVVISDLGMPNVTGWDVGREIKKICESRGIPKVPFILLTGWGNQQGEEERILESGVDEIVMKPVDLGNLLTVIDKITFSKASS